MSFLKKHHATPAAGGRSSLRKIEQAPDVLLKPLVSEKASRLQPQGQYTFVVRPGVSKVEVKKAVEAAYGVRVVGVNSVTLPRKTLRRGRALGRTRLRRHVVVRLAKGESLNVAPA